MANFVLTGAATINGYKVLRDDLIRHLNKLGHYVDNKVAGHTNYLVASRHDTKKARDARNNGVHVITYTELDYMLRGDHLGDGVLA